MSPIQTEYLKTKLMSEISDWKKKRKDATKTGRDENKPFYDSSNFSISVAAFIY